MYCSHIFRILTHICQMADTHLLGVCICIVCPGGAVFWHWALKWVMVPNSTGLYVGLVG